MTENNTYILDRESVAEMMRLLQLDQFTIRAMGGPLEEHPDPPQLRQIKDLASGSGGLVLDVAFDYPGIEVMGVDISEMMIRYTLTRAQSQLLDFAENSFDLVNSRLLVGVLDRTAWSIFLQGCYRLLDLMASFI